MNNSCTDLVHFMGQIVPILVQLTLKIIRPADTPTSLVGRHHPLPPDEGDRTNVISAAIYQENILSVPSDRSQKRSDQQQERENGNKSTQTHSTGHQKWHKIQDINKIKQKKRSAEKSFHLILQSNSNNLEKSK